MEIEINLLRDLGMLLRRVMSEAGYDASRIETDDRETLVTWMKVNRYEIRPLPRQVLKARGFDPQGHEAGIEILENAIRRGDPIRKHMTKRVEDIAVHDGLLDYWDIHHLHLGTEIDPKSGLIKRTNHILLCRFDDERAYFIMVAPHGAGAPNTWYRQEMLEIIHDNWPESIDFARVPGVSEVALNFTDDDIKKLRESHVSLLLQVSDGAVYVEPGFGTTGDGTNPTDSLRANRIVRAARRIEARIADELPRIRENARRQGYHFRSPAISCSGVYDSTTIGTSIIGISWNEGRATGFGSPTLINGTINSTSVYARHLLQHANGNAVTILRRPVATSNMGGTGAATTCSP